MSNYPQSFTMRLKATNEGRGSDAPTIALDLLCTSVKPENVEKMLGGFHALLTLAVEIQETVPSKV